jgi:cell division protease FtsH
MSDNTELGLVSYSPDTAGKDMMYGIIVEKEYSEKTAEAIDDEIKKLIDTAYKKAKELIEANKDKVERIAKALLKYETLDADDVNLILKGGELDKPTVTDLLAVEQARKEQSKPEAKGYRKKSSD